MEHSGCGRGALGLQDLDLGINSITKARWPCTVDTKALSLNFPIYKI